MSRKSDREIMEAIKTLVEDCTKGKIAVAQGLSEELSEEAKSNLTDLLFKKLVEAHVKLRAANSDEYEPVLESYFQDIRETVGDLSEAIAEGEFGRAADIVTPSVNAFKNLPGRTFEIAKAIDAEFKALLGAALSLAFNNSSSEEDDKS